MGVLGFYVVVLGNLHRLFGSQELRLEDCVWSQFIFDLDVLKSGADGCRDGQIPRKEEL